MTPEDRQPEPLCVARGALIKIARRYLVIVAAIIECACTDHDRITRADMIEVCKQNNRVLQASRDSLNSSMSVVGTAEIAFPDMRLHDFAQRQEIVATQQLNDSTQYQWDAVCAKYGVHR